MDSGTVRFIWRNLPWIGAESRRAAEASACAHAQGKFWPYHDTLFARQKGYNRENFSEANLVSFAGEAGLDEEQLAGCLKGQHYAQTVADEFQAARKLGVTATPTFLVNGRKVVGAQSYEKWVEIIEAALKEKGS